jgi:hypothetical protein
MTTNFDMIVDGGGSVGNFDTQPAPASQKTIDRLLAAQAADEKRGVAAKPGSAKEKEILNRINNRQEKIDIATGAITKPTTTPTTTPTTITPTTTTPTTVTPTVTETDTDALYLQFLKDQAALGRAENQQTARATLEVFLRQFFFGSDAGFVNDALAAAEGDIKSGLPTDVILLKLQNYDDPKSLFSRRFAGNVSLRKEGIEPLSPAEYLEQERRYREAMSTRGLGELATRGTFADLIGNQVSPFELEDRITKVFDIYDGADAALKTELQTTLNLDPLSARTSVAKALLLGEKGATELQRQVRTAEVGTEARARGLEVGRAGDLAAMGVTREQARAGFEQISLTQPRLTQLSEIYDKTTPDASGVQQELEREQFQGMQSQRRKRLAEQEQASFMGQSGTAGAQSLSRRRTGSY